MPTKTYKPIATTTLGSATASYTFNSIPSTYTDLVLVVNGTAASGANMLIQFNSDTSTNYSATRFIGEPTGASSDRITNSANLNVGVMGTSVTTNIIQIQNYSNTTTNKTTLSRASSSTIWSAKMVSLWRSTAAINSLKVYLASSVNFDTGSTFTLYGIE